MTPLKKLIDKPFVWFDLDDTIWDMSGNSCISLRILFDTDAAVQQAFGQAGLQEWLDVYHAYNADLWRKYEAESIDRATLRLERFALPLQHGGLSREQAVEAARRLDGDYLRYLGDCPGTVAGAHRAVQAVKAAGIPVGIVSNGFREVQYRKLVSGGFEGWFHPVVLSDDTGVNKPQPAFFRAAEARAGVRPEQCVIVGDNPRSDILGALRAGWARAYWLRSDADGSLADYGAEPELQERCVPFGSLAELPLLMGL